MYKYWLWWVHCMLLSSGVQCGKAKETWASDMFPHLFRIIQRGERKIGKLSHVPNSHWMSCILSLFFLRKLVFCKQELAESSIVFLLQLHLFVKIAQLYFIQISEIYCARDLWSNHWFALGHFFIIVLVIGFQICFFLWYIVSLLFWMMKGTAWRLLRFLFFSFWFKDSQKLQMLLLCISIESYHEVV